MAAESINLIIPNGAASSIRRLRVSHELLANEASEAEMDELSRKFEVLSSW
jgi:hypothetical protein